MAQPSELRISCNDHSRRIWLRVLGLLFPLWGIGGAGAVLFVLSSNSVNLPDFARFLIYLGCAMMAAGVSASLVLLQRDLKLDGLSIWFPGNCFKRFSGEALVQLTACDGFLRFHFRNKNYIPSSQESLINNSNTIVKKIALKRMPQKDLHSLLAFVGKHHPACRIDESIYSSAGVSELEIDAAKELSIPYQSHVRQRAFFDVLGQYENVFWYFWFAIFGPLFVCLVPLLMVAPFWWISGAFQCDMTNFFAAIHLNAVLDISGQAINKYFETVGRPTVYGLQGFCDFLQKNDLAAAAFGLMGIVLTGLGLRSLAKPTAFVLSPAGFRLESSPLGILIDLRSFNWSECRKIALDSSADKTAETKLEFLDSAGEPMCTLDMRAIPELKHRVLIKQAINLWAPQLELDPLFIESVSTSQRQSYTELWLQSLNSPPKRDRLVPLKKGDRLQSGLYEIVEIIGAGGQGVAYLAERVCASEHKTSQVVIKEFMLPVYVDRRARQQALERFEHESQMLRSLNDENIVSLLDHFVEDHRAYLVLEHVNGKPLRKLAGLGGIRDEGLLIELLKQMCGMLTYLHQQSPPMVHRDFAPDNLILQDTGVLKLIDFNVAHQASNKAKVTVVGKHAYMPPEQFAGRPCPQSDIYAHGATLYYLMAGTDPEPFSQSGLPPGCETMSPVLGEIIMRSTALSLSDRFQSAAEILELLQGKTDCGDDERIDLSASFAREIC